MCKKTTQFYIKELLLSLIFIICNSYLLHAQELKNSNQTILSLEELIVKTEKPSPFQPLVRVISVIQKAEIESMAVNNIQDLLKYVQGADIRSRGSEGVQADLNILGGTFDQSVVMINGINFTDPQTGHHSLNIPIEIEQIERIELLHGPGAWTEGGIAFSGAINIITKLPTEIGANVSISGGSYGYIKGSSNVNIINNKSEKWSSAGQIGAGYSQSDGYTNNTDFKIINFYTNHQISDNKNNNINIQAGYQQKEFGANSFYSIRFPEQFEETRTILYSAQYSHQTPKTQFNITAYHRIHFDRFELFRNESPQWYNGHNYHMNNIAGVNFKMAYKWAKIGTTIIGGEFRHENVYSTVLGNPLKSNINAIFEKGIEYDKYKDRDITSLYIKHLLYLDKWRFSAGVMINNKLYYGLALSYQITPFLEANWWANNSFRNPSFTDLYYRSPTQTGNTNLLTEEAITSQFGLKYNKYNFRGGISAFYRKGSRIIDWVRESESDQWIASNLTNVNSFGVDINMHYIPQECIINRVGFNYSWLNVIKDSENYISLYATDFLRHKVNIFLDHSTIDKLSFRWDLSLNRRAGTYLNKENIETKYGTYAIVDLKIVWKERKYTPFLELSNLFNSDYLYIGNLPQPKRWIKAGITIHI